MGRGLLVVTGERVLGASARLPLQRQQAVAAAGAAAAHHDSLPLALRQLSQQLKRVPHFVAVPRGLQREGRGAPVWHRRRGLPCTSLPQCMRCL